jgi:hypothetical protein
VITHVWRAWTAALDATEYARQLDRTTVARLASADGNRGVLVHWELRGGRTEFTVLAFWESAEAATAFSGWDDALGPLVLEADDGPRPASFYIRGELALGAGVLDF